MYWARCSETLLAARLSLDLWTGCLRSLAATGSTAFIPPLRAILIAANHVGIDDQGQPTRYEDIDCYAGLAGAIAGALYGADAFPAEMLAQVQESNLIVYGIDLEASITRFIKTFA